MAGKVGLLAREVCSGFAMPGRRTGHIRSRKTWKVMTVQSPSGLARSMCSGSTSGYRAGLRTCSQRPKSRRREPSGQHPLQGEARRRRCAHRRTMRGRGRRFRPARAEVSEGRPNSTQRRCGSLRGGARLGGKRGSSWRHELSSSRRRYRALSGVRSEYRPRVRRSPDAR